MRWRCGLWPASLSSSLAVAVSCPSSESSPPRAASAAATSTPASTLSQAPAPAPPGVCAVRPCRRTGTTLHVQRAAGVVACTRLMACATALKTGNRRGRAGRWASDARQPALPPTPALPGMCDAASAPLPAVGGLLMLWPLACDGDDGQAGEEGEEKEEGEEGEGGRWSLDVSTPASESEQRRLRACWRCEAGTGVAVTMLFMVGMVARASRIAAAPNFSLRMRRTRARL